jgi:hypothetical protein
MSDTAEKKLSKAEVAALRELRLEATNLQAIEGNPLDAEDIAMFEMFEREGRPHAAPVSQAAGGAGGPSPRPGADRWFALARGLDCQPRRRLRPVGGSPSAALKPRS